MHMRISKQTADVETAFEDWWKAQSEDFMARYDKQDLQRGFKAGFAAGRKKQLRRFTFMAGKMRVTIWAANHGTAKAMASQEADRRAAAAGVSPPRSGWTLRLVGADSP